MARSTKAIHAPELEDEDAAEWEYEDEEFEPSPALRLLWLAGMLVWGLLAAAMISYDPADPPGHAMAPRHAAGEIANWIGPVGAAASHHAFLMLGSGAWIILLSGGAYLLYIAFRGTIDHAPIRFLGVGMLALAFSAFHNLFFPGASALPEGSGGLLAITAVHELSSRFGALGATLWISLLAAIGATVAYDRWLIVVPQAVASVAFSASDRVTGLIDSAAARRAERRNDIDDDEKLATVTTVIKTAARRAKGGGAGAEDAAESEARPAKRRRAPAPVAVVEAEDEEDGAPEGVVEAYEEEDDEADAGPDAPQVFTEDQLRDKIAKLPVRFAQANKKLASEDDLEALRAQRRSEEEADRNYRYPGLDLLTDPEENYADELESYIRDQAASLENALSTYKIDGHVAGVESGPVITLYQVSLTPGTKVSSVQAVASDLARMLKATNIRIVPNTEGLDTIGIEVPNSKKEKVRLKELMACSDSTRRMKLPLFLGKDASGNPLIVDLASLPHLLIAGTTGSGKSVCMNAVIMGFLYTQKPSDLKLVLVDPKMVELSQFKDIPHLMCPVVTEMSKAAAILEWAVGKMDERYELLAEAGCRDITAYNSLGWDELKDRLRPTSEVEEARIPRKLPYLVFVIDELADLIMTNKEVEVAIVRIAQKARAVGIHLILATQRPQANVVTGLIKSNMPGRVAFKVASGMDSRIVLDQKGGELLLGQGDMLMLTPRSSTTIRAQGTLVDDGEIRRVVRFIRDHAGQNFENALITITNHGYQAQIHEDRMRASAQEDPLFDRAVEMVIESGRGSVSMLQRQLAIGYTRSARLIEMMGEAGILGTHKGTVARDVVMTIDEWNALKEMAEKNDAEESLVTPEEAAARLAAQPRLFAEDDASSGTAAAPGAGLDHDTAVSGAETSALLGSGLAATRTEHDDERIVDHAPTGADQYANATSFEESDDWLNDDDEDDPEGVTRELAAELQSAAALGSDFTRRAEAALDQATSPGGASAETRPETEIESAVEAEAEAEEAIAEEEAEEEADDNAEVEDGYAEAGEYEEEGDDTEAAAEADDEEEPEDEYEAEDEAEDDAEAEYEEAEGEEEYEYVDAEDGEEDPEAEYEDEAEDEAEEYEYEYVDEEGNPIDPEDLDEEYEYVDEEEDAEVEAEAKPAATEPATPQLEIRTNALTSRSQNPAA